MAAVKLAATPNSFNCYRRCVREVERKLLVLFSSPEILPLASSTMVERCWTTVAAVVLVVVP